MPRAKVRIKINHAGDAEILNSANVEAALVPHAQAAAAQAQATAPVRTGAYRDSIHVEVEQTRDGVVATVIADVRHAMIVESREGTLARALGKAASRA